MKKLKKAISVLLACAVVMAYSGIAFAADITVTNPQDGETYTAYKIFSLSKNGTNYDYTLDSSSAAYTLLTSALASNQAAEQLPAGVSLTATTGQTNDGNVIYNASVAQGKAADFAKWLKARAARLDATKAKSGAIAGEEYKINIGSDLGYYFVNTNVGALANLTTATDELNIRDKNEEPGIEKTVSDASVEVGQTVTYTVTGEVPDTSGYTSYVYKVSDTMSSGLTFNASVSAMKVKIGNNVLVGTAGQGETDATANPNAPSVSYANNGFVLQFDMTKFQSMKGDPVEITYNALVNDNAVVTVTNNSAVLTFSNDPADPSHTKDAPPKEVEVYSSKIIVDKYKSGATSTKLPHAKFILVKKTTSGNTTAESYYKYTAAANGSPATVEWVSDKAQATVVETDANGAASFNGLEDGTYYLRETKAPEGYNLLTADVECVVAHTTDATTQKAVGVALTKGVANNSGTILPNTGGVGTIILTLLGVLLAAAGIFLSPRRRKA